MAAPGRSTNRGCGARGCKNTLRHRRRGRHVNWAACKQTAVREWRTQQTANTFHMGPPAPVWTSWKHPRATSSKQGKTKRVWMGTFRPTKTQEGLSDRTVNSAPGDPGAKPSQRECTMAAVGDTQGRLPKARSANQGARCARQGETRRATQPAAEGWGPCHAITRAR